MKKSALRMLSLLLAMVLCFGLFACGEQPADPTTVPTQATTAATTEPTTPPTTEAPTEGTEPINYNVIQSSNPIKNVILIIGDGMGLKHLDAGMFYDGKTYEFTNWPMVRINTYPLADANGTISDEPTDSAASGTAMATGVLTANGRLGNDFANNQLPTIMDVANEMGKATGVVVTDALHGATPGAFSGHASYRDNVNEIIPSQLTSGVNLLCGFAESKYTLIADQIRSSGYAYCEDFNSLESTFSSEYALWQLDMYGVDATTPLEVVTPKALDYLSQDPDGFVLMIEQAHIDKYCHDSQLPVETKFENVCKSVSSLNKTVELVMEWVGDRTDTLVLVTADHETGGLQVSEKPGKYENDYTIGDTTISYEFRGTNHTGMNVALYVYGVEADFTLSSLYSKKALKNTGIYYLMEEALRIGTN